MPEPVLPEAVEKALAAIPCNAERGCAAEISMPDLDCQAFHTAIIDLRRAITAALLRAEAEGAERTADCTYEECQRFSRQKHTQADALERGGR